MNAPTSPLRMSGLMLTVALAALAGSFVYWRAIHKQQPDVKTDARVTDRKEKEVTFKRPEDATNRGIEAEAVRAVSWRPKVFVDGRVVPNPQATLEVRAPFAGILRGDSSDEKLRLGAPVEANDLLAHLEARLSPTERVDLKTKLVEAEARHHGAEEVLKIRQERVGRLEKLAVGILSQDDFDAASVQLSDARTQKNIAFTQWNIWKQTLESVGKKSIIVPIPAPITGVVTEVGAQPGAFVDTGHLLARIVDFRRALLRLDFPLAGAAVKPSSSVTVEALDAPDRWRALLRGPATNIEVGLQKASYYYELVPDERGASPRWQSGLYVKAILDDPAKTAQPALAIPASALLVHQGRTLVYVQRRLGRYERREVQIHGRDGDTVYLADGVRSDEWVVTKCAQVLLSEEFRSDTDDD